MAGSLWMENQIKEVFLSGLLVSKLKKKYKSDLLKNKIKKNKKP